MNKIIVSILIVIALIIGFFGGYLTFSQKKESLVTTMPISNVITDSKEYVGTTINSSSVVSDGKDFFSLFAQTYSGSRYEKQPFAIQHQAYYPTNIESGKTESINLIEQITCHICVSYSIVDTNQKKFITNLFPYHCDTDCGDQLTPIAILDKNLLIVEKMYFETDHKKDIIVTDFNENIIKTITTLEDREEIEVPSIAGSLGDVDFSIVTYSDDYRENEVGRKNYTIDSKEMIIKPIN